MLSTLQMGYGSPESIVHLPKVTQLVPTDGDDPVSTVPSTFLHVGPGASLSHPHPLTGPTLPHPHGSAPGQCYSGIGLRPENLGEPRGSFHTCLSGLPTPSLHAPYPPSEAPRAPMFASAVRVPLTLAGPLYLPMEALPCCSCVESPSLPACPLSQGTAFLGTLVSHVG